MLSRQGHVKGGCIWMYLAESSYRSCQACSNVKLLRARHILYHFIMPAENALRLSDKLSIKLSKKRVPSKILKN